MTVTVLIYSSLSFTVLFLLFVNVKNGQSQSETTMLPPPEILFPFGEVNGDFRAPPGDDRSFGPIELEVPLILYRQAESTLYVSTNGLISFRNEFNSFRATPFSSDFTEFLNPLIAPLWTDFDPFRSGSIYYRMTNNSLVLERIRNILTEESDTLVDYTPSLAFIVTWDRIPLFVNLTVIHTFQVILSTDGISSFATFIYQNLTSLSVRQDFQTGFSSGDRSRFSNILQNSLRAFNTFRIDGNCITSIFPSEVCDLNSTSLTCDGLRSVRCACGFGDQSSKCSELIPFGLQNGDELLATAIGGSFGPFDLPIAVVFFQNKEHHFYISTNGLISFGSPFTSFSTSELPSAPIIAPLWADYDFRNSGEIFYRVSQDMDTLSFAAGMLNTVNPNLQDFQPRLCIVVTWIPINVLSEFSSVEVPDTFQALVCTDGQASFAGLIYGNLTGTTEFLVNEFNSVVGFDAGDRIRNIMIYEDLEYINLFRIDGNCITTIFPGALCKLNTIALDCNSFNNATSCLCSPGFTGNNSDCDLQDFIPFGIGNGDILDSRLQAIDAAAGPIVLDVPIVFYQKHYYRAYVSTNGLISFDEQFLLYIVMSFPRSSAPLVPLIAPLWADFNFRANGFLYHRVTNDNGTLKRITRAISTLNSDFMSYEPTQAVITTWFKATLNQHQNGEVNFQAILATDGNISFAIFISDEDTNDVLSNFDNNEIPVITGFDSGDGIRGDHSIMITNSLVTKFGRLFSDMDRSKKVHSYRIDGNCITLVTNDICGLNSVPIRCGLVMMNDGQNVYQPTLCLCNVGFEADENITCLDFFQFGSRVGDGTISQAQSSVVIHIETPVIFYGRQELILEISLSGYISFGTGFLSSFSTFPLNSSTPIPLIAVKWIEADFSVRQQIILNHRVAKDNASLSMIVRVITGFNPDLTDFKPILAVIITWETILTEMENNFSQAILTTDGKASFTILLYENGTTCSLSNCVVGFDAGDTIRSTVINDNLESTLLQEKNVFRVDGGCITSASPSDMCGLNSVATKCNNLRATECSCNEGYESEDGLSCSDIDECDSSTSVCNEHATCTNTPGSYECHCNSGFSENGFICEDIDECNNSLNTCLEVPCINTIGSYNCSCDIGFELQNDSTACRDVNECDRIPCDENADCINSEGSFRCQCNQMFSGDGFTCTASSTQIVEVSVSVGVLIVVLAVLLAVALMIFLVIHRKKSNKLKHLNNQLSTKELNGENEYIFSMRNISVQSSFKHKLPKSLIVPSCNLTLGKTIGQGEFGIVYKGLIKQGFSDTISDSVAVKTLKGFIQKDLVNDLLKECAKMYEFDHPNILKLSGVCLDGGPAPYIIMPFMENGSLLAHLKEERQNIVLAPEDTDVEEVSVAQRKLLDMCLQVAKGMEYLASKRVVHRDLAARNCMIDMNFVIKVADFGLAESMDTTKEYYRQNEDVIIKLPIKWLALESTMDGLFSEKSDVWSYGVTCWEIFSGGKSPYAGIHPSKLPQKLETGYRMEKPLNAACSEDIFSFISHCWDCNPEERPSFSELVPQISSKLLMMADYMDFSVGSVTNQVELHEEGAQISIITNENNNYVLASYNN